MGRSPCCDKLGLKKGPWTPEEDQKLLAYIGEHGHGSWRSLPEKAGLHRCGKSCRLRWTNYLRPDIKRGKFNLQEEQTIIQLHALLGNRSSLKKRLVKMGIDPVTHKPKNETPLSSLGLSKNAAILSHTAQWESARLEAEARLARESKLLHLQHYQTKLSSHHHHHGFTHKTLLSNWTTKRNEDQQQLEDPTSTESISEIKESVGISTKIEFVGSSTGVTLIKEPENEWLNPTIHGFATTEMADGIEEGFTGLLLAGDSIHPSFSGNKNETGGESSSGGDCNYYEDNKNYWIAFLTLWILHPPIYSLTL